jgi:hypothetical protein
MVEQDVVVKLRPVVRFREFPFGTREDVSMRAFMAPWPWEDQDKALAYLRSGKILAYPMGADLVDWFDRPNRANPTIDSQCVGGTTPLTDGSGSGTPGSFTSSRGTTSGCRKSFWSTPLGTDGVSIRRRCRVGVTISRTLRLREPERGSSENKEHRDTSYACRRGRTDRSGPLRGGGAVAL